MITLHTLLALAALYLAFAVGHQLLYATAAVLLPPPRPVRRDDRERKFVIFVDAFRADATVVDAVRRSLRLRYSPDAYEVVVLAEGLRPYTLAQLSDTGVEVVETSFSESGGVQRLRAGVDAVAGRNYDAVVLVRAAHQLAPHFLQHANAYLSAGFGAVQGNVVPPPGEPVARLRLAELSGAIDQQLDGLGRQVLGHSARLFGSGAVVDRAQLHDALVEMPASANLAEELNRGLARRGESVAFAVEAAVYGARAAARRRGSLVQFVRGLRVWTRAGGAELGRLVLHAACPARMLLPSLLLCLTTVCLALALPLAGVFALLFLANLGSLALAAPAGRWTESSWLTLSQSPRLVWTAATLGLGRPRPASARALRAVAPPVRPLDGQTPEAR